MNLVKSPAESYAYAEVFNRKYEGGSEISEKIMTAGLAVKHLIGGTDAPILGGGGSGSMGMGNLSEKTIPAGLVLNCRRNKRQIKYESHLEEGSSGVISDELFDHLFDAITPQAPRRRTHAASRRLNAKKSSNLSAKTHRIK